MTENNNNNMYIDNSLNQDYIEYYMLHNFDNSWIPICYCRNCGILSDPDMTFNFYKVKTDFYCQKCYIDIQQNHMKRNVKWYGFLYFESVKESIDLK